MQDLNLGDLRVLAVLLEERSVTRASARLGVSQPGVSHALARLRARIGDALFVRTSRGLAPTPRAELIAKRLPEAMRAIDGVLADDAAFDAATSERRFVIASADYAATVVLPGLSARLEREAPRVSVIVRPPPEDLAGALASGQVDLAIDLERDGQLALRRQRLFRERFACLARAGHPGVRGRLTLERYLALRHVVVAPRGNPGSIVDETLAVSGLRRDIALTVPHFLVAPQVVAQSDLVVTIASRIAGSVASPLGLEVHEPPMELPSFALAQVWHPRSDKEPGHKWLRASVRSSVRSPG